MKDKTRKRNCTYTSASGKVVVDNWEQPVWRYVDNKSVKWPGNTLWHDVMCQFRLLWQRSFTCLHLTLQRDNVRTLVSASKSSFSRGFPQAGAWQKAGFVDNPASGYVNDRPCWVAYQIDFATPKCPNLWARWSIIVLWMLDYRVTIADDRILVSRSARRDTKDVVFVQGTGVYVYMCD